MLESLSQVHAYLPINDICGFPNILLFIICHEFSQPVHFNIEATEQSEVKYEEVVFSLPRTSATEAVALNYWKQGQVH